MTKVRVHELAKELGLESKDVVDKLNGIGVPVKNHMGVIDSSDADRLKRTIERANAAPMVEERIRPTVVRRKKIASAEDEAVAEAPVAVPEHREAVHVAPTAHASPGGAAQVAHATHATHATQTAQVGAAVREERAEPRPEPRRETSSGEHPHPAAVRPAPAAPVRNRFDQEPSDARPRAAEGHREPHRSEPRRPNATHSPEIQMRAPNASHAQVTTADLPPAGPGTDSQPPSSQDRFAHAQLPPGVMRRGNAAAPTAASRLSEADRQRIVQEHMASRPAMPLRREMRSRQSIGPAARPQPRLGKKRPMPGSPGSFKKSMSPNITVPSEKKRVIRIEDQIQLQMLASRMSLKATELLMKLMQLGMSGVHINSTLDADTAALLASEFGYEVENVARTEDDIVGDARGTFEDNESDREGRPPVVTVMGHVDHGKTSLLDRIRRTKVAAGEAGGITQHIGAYRVETDRGTIVFLDTPGHEAFTAMRARGAQATDIVILVVAADDGVMPQTKEAIAHAKAAKVPIVVAINKIDKADAKIERVKQELSGEGLQAEDWGGDVMMVPCSAHSGAGIEQLLEGILVTAEVLELRANTKIPAEGVVLEAYLDRGRGPVANVLVRNGSLRAGDYVVAGGAWGRVRALTDDRGKQLRVAGPATPVEVLGLQELPSAGDHLYKVTDQRKAQEVAEARKPATVIGMSATARGLDQLQQMLTSGDVQELRLVVKADFQGSVEALVKSITDLATDKVKVAVIHSGVGGITENDIMLARASGAIIMGFNVRPQGKANSLAKSEGVEIRTYSIIYEAVDDVKAAMAGLLAPKLVEKELGEAEIRSVFTISKVGAVAGVMITDGKLIRAGKARIVRDGVVVWTGSIASLRRFKDDVKEVTNGFECGVTLAGFNDLKERDIIQCFEIEQVAATL